MNALRKKDLLTLVACAVLFAVMQGLMMAEIIGPFWELNIVLICINIILSVSLNLINGYTGQFSIGHAGFLAVGAYTGAIVTVKLGFSYELALIAGTVAAGFLGFLIGLPTLRLNGDYLAIATLGLGEIIRICLANGWMERDPFMNYHSKFNEVTRMFLNEKEIEVLFAKDFKNERLSLVRDIFLFSCFTGLAYIDTQKLTYQNINLGLDGSQWIYTKRQKTKTTSNIIKKKRL